MKTAFQASDPLGIASDALIVPVVKQDDGLALEAIGNDGLIAEITRLAADALFTGKRGSTLLIPTLGALPARRIVLAGAGSEHELNSEAVRQGYGSAVTAARNAGAKNVVCILPPVSDAFNREESVIAAVEAAGMATYRYIAHEGSVKSGKPKPSIESLTFASADGDGEAIEKAIAKGEAIANAVNLARDLSNEPASVLTPVRVAEIAAEVAQASGLEITIFDNEALAGLSANAIITVGQGSSNPPRMIHLVYRPGGATDQTLSIGLVGKCITFDTGGYSIKPTEGMADMKGDMAGGAAVLGAVTALKALEVPVVVHAVICAAENMISGDAFRPGDVIKGMNGVTMEILSTDAEGRLVLADGLVYTARQGVREMVDLATLTGAKVVALGNETVGLFSNNDELAGKLLAAAESAAEPMWRMPLSEHLESQIEGEIADIKNTGGRAGGSITAALFLQHFSEGLPWAHMDIAGSNRASKATAYTPKGATGVGVRTLLDFVRARDSQ
ncbi:leucyl aminopeptidase [soil metagenome]